MKIPYDKYLVSITFPQQMNTLKLILSTIKNLKFFAEKLKEKSDFNFNTDIQETDRILTLSTCYKKVERIVLHAKLIKREIKEN